jgi:hypothetical protein
MEKPLYDQSTGRFKIETITVVKCAIIEFTLAVFEDKKILLANPYVSSTE